MGRCGPQRAKVVTSCLLSESLCLAEHVSVCGRNWGRAELFCLVQVSGTEKKAGVHMQRGAEEKSL